MGSSNSFFSFMRKPVMCKCGHPNKPCHRSGKWYDQSRRCNECNCNDFVLRNVDNKINRYTELGAILGLGFVCAMIFFFAVSVQTLSTIDPKTGEQKAIAIPLSMILQWITLGMVLFGLWLSGFVFDFICLYMRTHGRPIMPIDEKWNKENES